MTADGPVAASLWGQLCATTGGYESPMRTEAETDLDLSSPSVTAGISPLQRWRAAQSSFLSDSIEETQDYITGTEAHSQRRAAGGVPGTLEAVESAVAGCLAVAAAPLATQTQLHGSQPPHQALLLPGQLHHGQTSYKAFEIPAGQQPGPLGLEGAGGEPKMDLESEEEEYDQMAEEFDDDIGRRVKQKQGPVADSSSFATLKLGGNRRKQNLRKSAIPNRRGFYLLIMYDRAGLGST